MTFSSFDDYWTPFLSGIGPAGDFVAGPSRRRARGTARGAANRRLGDGPIELTATARWASGTVPA